MPKRPAPGKKPSTSSNFLNPFLLSFFFSSLTCLLISLFLALTLVFNYSNLCFTLQLLPFFISFFFNLVQPFQPFINSLSSYLSISLAFLFLLFDFLAFWLLAPSPLLHIYLFKALEQKHKTFYHLEGSFSISSSFSSSPTAFMSFRCSILAQLSK